jgi:hypothetical protein
MKSFQSIAAILAYGVLAVTAAPAANTVQMRGDVNALVSASIFMCKDVNWSGECRNILVTLDTCSKMIVGKATTNGSANYS